MNAGTRWNDLARAVFIVPASHVRVLDAGFQARMYDEYHTRPLTLWAHRLCTPVILTALFALAESAAPGTGAALAALGLQLFYFVSHGARAWRMTPLVAALVPAAWALRDVTDPPGATALWTVAIIFSLLQTLSHLAERVPPPWSGGTDFVSLREALRRNPWPRLVELGLLSGTVFVVLELWAALRIWPLQWAGLVRRP